MSAVRQLCRSAVPGAARIGDEKRGWTVRRGTFGLSAAVADRYRTREGSCFKAPGHRCAYGRRCFSLMLHIRMRGSVNTAAVRILKNIGSSCGGARRKITCWEMLGGNDARQMRRA